MKKIFLFYFVTILYLEGVYHIASFGLKDMNPMLVLPLALFVAGVQTFCTGLFKEKVNKVLLWLFLAIEFVLYFAQLVYISIFNQPMLIDAVIGAGQAALTDFGKEAMNGILASAGIGLLMAVPHVVLGILLHKKKIVLERFVKKQFLGAGLGVCVGVFTMVLLLVLGYELKWTSYDEYQRFYDPSSVISRYGVLPSVQRDLLGNTLPAFSSALDVSVLLEDTDAADSSVDSMENDVAAEENAASEVEEIPEEEKIDTSPNVLNIDFDQIRENAESDLVKQLATYMEAMEPTNKNEYTGMFEGYNLIYMTAEGFSQYAVDEKLTPTLYKLTHSGFVIDDYYVPLWQTSTSDGEYTNLTGLIPDQQFSMRRSSANEQPFSLPAYFAAEGVKSYAYHNNSLSYYDRNLSHPNLGYDFKAAKLGKLTQEEGGGQLFDMENSDLWPTSDLDMMKATVSEYINEERFHAYYMTISGHLEYSFEGNDMSKLHQEEVADLPYNEANKAYIACNIELDKALEYLIEELDKAGKLENTVIAISADHYPYGLETSDLEEMAGYELDGTLDLYRNSLILWNSEMETVEIEKTCSSIDLLPTLLNLFGFDYDSRLYAGKDMLSDSESLVVFADQSFITDTMSYNNSSKELTMLDGSEENSEEFERIEQKVKGLFEYSAGILNEDFYRYVNEAIIQ